MAQNPDPVNYPCYKVVSTKGDLCGYSGPGGLKGKQKLLQKDGIKFSTERIDKKYFHTFGKM